ncbi:low-temperature-induced 65 kDa protein [Senna tora]|uniref:Low-temperature-induced 65 kDa protein n=1 Tax=Senna tora TaxID=362788 RepID=A0A834TIP6_9FABA|nr:low-temperature-induced 65 kDa protein [Senna tora]
MPLPCKCGKTLCRSPVYYKPVVQSQEQDRYSHNVGSQGVIHYGAEDEQHHDNEKKSVLKKVKEKARKIKDTIKKHGHHDHDHDLNEEDDEREEMAKTSEVQGAPIYDSANIAKSSFPGQVENQGKLESTSLVEEEVHHREPKRVVVTPTTESDQNRVTEPARTFVEQEVNLESRPINLEEDPHAPGNRPEAYTPSNYGTKVTDPTGLGTREIDIAPVQDSLARMNVQDEVKANPEARVLPIITETQCPTIQSHDQFSSEIFNPKNFPENLQAQPNVLPSAVDIQNPSVGSHDHKTKYPSLASHDRFGSESIPTNPYNFSEHLSVKSHDQVVPEISPSAKTQYPSSARHDQFVSDPIPTFSSGTPTLLSDTQYPYAGSHDQFLPEVTTSNFETAYPQGTGEMLNTATTTTTRVGEQPYSELTEKQPKDNFTEKISSETSEIADKDVSAKNAVGDNEEYRSEENPLDQNQSSYTQKISNATSAIADKAVSAKNVVSSKLGYRDEDDETRHEEYRSEENPSDQTQSSYTQKISNATSAIADKAASAKNSLASKLGYDEKGDNEESQTRHNEEYITEKKPSNQSSYTDKISSATSAIADKAVSAKNAVASKLGYDEVKGNNETSENYRSEEKPMNQSTYTEKISSATSTIADKAVSAKDAIVSKLGYGEKDDDVNDKETNSSNAEYAQKIALSLTEEMAPVYKNVTKEGERGVPVQDKGVSVRDYLTEKLRPGDEDKALKEVISDTLNKQKEEPVKSSLIDEDRTVSEEVVLGEHRLEKASESEKSDMNSPRKGVVDTLKNVVGSWFVKPEDRNQSSQVTGGEGYVSQGVEERKLQDSAN